MDLEIVMLSEVRQRRKNIVWHPLYVKSKKKWYKWTYLQNKQTQRLREKDMVSGGVEKTGGEG